MYDLFGRSFQGLFNPIARLDIVWAGSLGRTLLAKEAATKTWPVNVAFALWNIVRRIFVITITTSQHADTAVEAFEIARVRSGRGRGRGRGRATAHTVRCRGHFFRDELAFGAFRD